MTDQFPEFGGGQTWSQQSASRWRHLVDEVRAWSNIRVGPGLKLTKRIGTARIELVKQRARIQTAGIVLVELRYESQHDDYLVCKKSLPDGTSDIINVAKPFLLRRTPFDNQTINGVRYDYSSPERRVARTGSGDSLVVETHKITPPYLRIPLQQPGNRGFTRILAARVDRLDMKDTDGEDVLWISLDDPRMFAEVVS